MSCIGSETISSQLKYRSSSNGIGNVQLHVLMMERQKENKRIYTHQQEKQKKTNATSHILLSHCAHSQTRSLPKGKSRSGSPSNKSNRVQISTPKDRSDPAVPPCSSSFFLSLSIRLRYKNEAKCKTNWRINKNPPERPRHPTFPNKSDKIVPSCHFFYYRPSLAACALLPQSKEFCFSNDVKENKKEKTNVSSGRGIRRGI